MPGEDYSRVFFGCQLVLPIFCSGRNANLVTLAFFVCLLAPLSTVFFIYDGEGEHALRKTFTAFILKKGPVLASVTKNLLIVAQ